MNYGDLQEYVWNYMGSASGNTRLDHMVQQVKDDINFAQDEIYASGVYYWWMVDMGTITLVTGTSVYTLDDYCVKPLSFWTADTSAHEVDFRSLREIDRNGDRNSNLSGLSVGPYTLTMYPRTTTASSSGTDATVAEASTALTKTGGTDWTSADVGRLIRLNGEAEDYKVSAVGGVNALTLDRAYRGRLSGYGTTGTGSGLTTAKWEIGPPGRMRVEIMQASSSAPTLHYRFQRRHRKLVEDDDTPEMPSEFHYLLAYGALLRNNLFTEKDAKYQEFRDAFGRGLQTLRSMDAEEKDVEGQSEYESPVRTDAAPRGLPYGTYSRRWGYTRGVPH